MSGDVSKGIVIRAAVYMLLPALSLLAERATSYSEHPPKSYWDFIALGCAIGVASLTPLRAFIDQYISRSKEQPETK